MRLNRIRKKRSLSGKLYYFKQPDKRTGFRRYRVSAVLISVAYRITNDKDSAKYIVQDAYLKVLESNNEFKGASSLKTYLYRIVINKCIDAKRRRARWSSLVDLFTKENIQSSQDAFEKAEDKALIRKLLNAVPQKFRVPLILAEVEGMSYAEIADILKLSLNTIRTRIFRCRRKLRKDLEKAGYLP